MKNAMKQAVLGLALVLASGAVSADEPVLNILQPTGIVYLPGFPAVVPVGFQVNHAPSIKDVNVLKVHVDGVSILNVDDVGAPFKHAGAPSCAPILSNGSFTACTLDSETQARVGLNWTVPAPGSYSFVVSLKHQSATGDDEEIVQFLTLTAEYPAPPAVANAYMNANNPPKSKVRGCVISAIAELHAKDSAYGPKGGPYNEAVIRTDVDAFRALCGG